jgi:hypothetical protein
MNAAVTVSLVGQKPGRPPIERLLVDVQLRNDDQEARWVLFPSIAPTTGGGIDKLEQLTAKAGASTVAVGRLLGTGGRYALRLGPGARVTLRKLEVSWWHEDGKIKELALEVQLASKVTAGAEDLVTWFDKDPTINGAAEVDMESAQHTASHRAPGDKEQALTATSARTETIKLTTP